MRALRHGIRNDAKDSHRGQHQRQSRKEPQQQCYEALLFRGLGDYLAELSRFRNGQLTVQFVDRPCYGGNLAERFSGRPD